MNKKALFSLFLGGALSVVMLFFAFRNVPLAELASYLHSINYFWLVPTTAIVVLSFVIRTWRWQIILKGAGQLAFWKAFHPLMIGFMMNCVLPGRVGDLVARPLLLKKNRQVPMATGLATVAAERTLDILFLIVLFTAVFSRIFSHDTEAVRFGTLTLSNQTLHMLAWVLIRLGLLLLGSILLLTVPWSRARITGAIVAFTRFRILSGPGRIRSLIVGTALFFNKAIENISVGFNLVFYPGRLVACFLLTAAVWGLTLASYLVLALGFPGIHLSAWDWTTVMVVVCFFIALPSAPGFWGLWEAGGVFALSLFGIGAKEAAGMTLVAHAVQMFPVILIGFLSATLTSVNIFRISGKRKELVAAT